MTPHPPGIPPYAELRCLSNFSFLRGASRPEELVARATRSVERAAIEAALAQTGSASAAAERLGISRAGLYNKMKEYAIVPRGHRE